MLITLLRVVARYSEDQLLGLRQPEEKDGKVRVNFKNALAAFARHFEELLLQHSEMLRDSISRMVEGVSACRYRERPGRSYPRQSKQPCSKWVRRKKAA